MATYAELFDIANNNTLLDRMTAAAEAVKQLEAHKAILADDEEVLMLFVQVISED